MKKYLLILVALSALLWAAEPNVQLNLYAKVHSGDVELKWMRLGYSNKSFFRLYRSEDGKEEREIALIKPASYTWLKDKGYDEDYLFFIYPFHGIQTDEDRLDVLRSSSVRDGFRLMKIIQDNQFAKNCGLYYRDDSIKKGSRYTYRVEEYNRNRKLSSTKVRLVGGKALQTQRVRWVQAVDEHTALGFNFDTSSGYGFYNLYRKLPSQKEFIRLNKLPRFVSDVSDPTREALFHDKEIAMGKTAQYYVTKVDMFGIEGPASHTIHAKRTALKPVVKRVKGIHVINTDKKITLHWKKDPMVIGYDVYRGQIYQGKFTKQNTKPLQTNHFADRDFKTNTNYYYYVVANNMYGSSQPSNKVLAYAKDATPPSRPTVLVADLNGSEVKLSWKASKDENLLGYRVYMSMDKKAQEWSMINKLEVNASTFIHKRAKTLSRHDYYYRVTAVDVNYNESKASNIIKVRIQDTIAPPQPVVLRHVVRANQIELQWNAIHTYDFAYYNLYRVDAKTSHKLNKTPLKQTLFVDQSPKKGLNRYVVTAVDLSGNESNRTTYIDVMQQDVTAVQIDAFKAVMQKNGVRLSFVVKDSDYNGFEVMRRSGADPRYYNISGFQKGVNYLDDSAIKGQHYFYTIKAYDKIGNIVESDVVEIKIKG